VSGDPTRHRKEGAYRRRREPTYRAEKTVGARRNPAGFAVTAIAVTVVRGFLNLSMTPPRATSDDDGSTATPTGLRNVNRQSADDFIAGGDRL